MTESESNSPIEVKDLYRTLIDTRNLEINLFWQRSNYFLVLNSGIVVAFFNLRDTKYAVMFGSVGFIVSLLWFWVCLGSKFWQTRWEQRLADFENEHLPGLEFFSAKRERIDSDVKRGFEFQKLGLLQRSVYGLARRKPSVSYSMIKVSALFALAWAAFIVTLVK